MWLSLQLFIERLKNSVPCSSSSSQRRNSQPSTRCFNENAEKPNEIYQEMDFLRGTEGHLLTSSGCLLTLVSSLNVTGTGSMATTLLVSCGLFCDVHFCGQV